MMVVLGQLVRLGCETGAGLATRAPCKKRRFGMSLLTSKTIYSESCNLVAGLGVGKGVWWGRDGVARRTRWSTSWRPRRIGMRIPPRRHPARRGPVAHRAGVSVERNLSSNFTQQAHRCGSLLQRVGAGRGSQSTHPRSRRVEQGAEEAPGARPGRHAWYGG
jgi:hypothetical protein